jgi:hypothetical protein
MGRATGRLSARLDETVARRLADRSARTSENKSRLVERYVDEGMRMDDHPGIVFRDGPSGRRAGLVVGPDVWEVMSVVRNVSGSGDAVLRQAAEALDLSPDQVRLAVRYYSDYSQEIDERIRRNREESASAEAAWKREQAALG